VYVLSHPCPAGMGFNYVCDVNALFPISIPVIELQPVSLVQSKGNPTSTKRITSMFFVYIQVAF